MPTTGASVPVSRPTTPRSAALAYSATLANRGKSGCAACSDGHDFGTGLTRRTLDTAGLKVPQRG